MSFEMLREKKYFPPHNNNSLLSATMVDISYANQIKFIWFHHTWGLWVCYVSVSERVEKFNREKIYIKYEYCERDTFGELLTMIVGNNKHLMRIMDSIVWCYLLAIISIGN